MLADRGGEVVGIDLSRRMGLRCHERSVRESIHADFVTGDAAILPFDQGVFEIVCGMRTIHHITDLPALYREIHRVLKPSGKAVFIEPLKMNPVVEFNRRILNPDKRTKWEHPLTMGDIRAAESVFEVVDVETFYLISPLALVFEKLVAWKRLCNVSYRSLQKLEKPLMNVPRLREFCWQLVMILRKGENDTQGS